MNSYFLSLIEKPRKENKLHRGRWSEFSYCVTKSTNKRKYNWFPGLFLSIAKYGHWQITIQLVGKRLRIHLNQHGVEVKFKGENGLKFTKEEILWIRDNSDIIKIPRVNHLLRF